MRKDGIYSPIAFNIISQFLGGLHGIRGKRIIELGPKDSIGISSALRGFGADITAVGWEYTGEKDIYANSEIVSYLDKFVISQKDAKKTIALALRTRYRRMQLLVKIVKLDRIVILEGKLILETIVI